MMQFQLIVEKTKTGFSAYSPDFPVFTTGGSKDELLENAVEAFNLWFEDEGQVLGIDQIKLIFN
ncbi:type II toxin-antitoxin system HicB family antitoxin [Algoriphagus sp.]|uniref:type II toxin-antitoxin system HicB family antitoxin n=1 Tax=Algoriphagus sp. TaxID=1872435 RepID=UPI0039188F5F